MKGAVMKQLASAPAATAKSVAPATADDATYTALWSRRMATMRSLKTAIRRNDHVALEALYAEWSEDLTLLPSTPAWTGWGASGRLAVVSQSLVFFQEKLLGGWKVRFVMDGSNTTVRGHPLAWTGTVGMRLDDGQSHHTVALTPPRYVKLNEVSAPAEEPGWSEVVDKLSRGLDSLDSVGSTAEALGLDQITEIAGEAFSAIRSFRIARVHRAMWTEMLNRLARGESAPFLASQEANGDAKPRKVASRRRTNRAPTKAASSTESRHAREPHESSVGGPLTIEQLAEQSGLTPEQVAAIVEALTSLALAELRSEGSSRIPRLGTLVLNRASIGFRPTAAFRAAVNNASEARVTTRTDVGLRG